MSQFHKTLRDHCKGKNMSALARELDMPRSILQDWIQERRSPSMKNLEYVKRIAEYLGISFEELLIGEKSSTTLSSISFEDNGRKYQINIHRLK